MLAPMALCMLGGLAESIEGDIRGGGVLVVDDAVAPGYAVGCRVARRFGDRGEWGFSSDVYRSEWEYPGLPTMDVLTASFDLGRRFGSHGYGRFAVGIFVAVEQVGDGHIGTGPAVSAVAGVEGGEQEKEGKQGDQEHHPKPPLVVDSHDSSLTGVFPQSPVLFERTGL